MEHLVWRTFLAHDFVELVELHLLIQMTMGISLDADGILLCDVLAGSTEFEYIYDFGDGWQHKVEIIKSLEHDPRMHYPVCIRGENACPPEDCGGAHGFSELKKVLAGKECTAKNEPLSWVDGFYEPSAFDPNLVNRLFLWAEIP